jgi:hypothetical protein
MRRKNIRKLLTNQYSLSHARTIYITPLNFLRTTYREQKLKANPRREQEIFNEKYLGKKTQYPTRVFKTFREYRKGVIVRRNVRGIKAVLIGKKKSKYGIPIPFLEYNKKGEPVGHEGRHTAEALHQLGYKKIPIKKVIKWS